MLCFSSLRLGFGVSTKLEVEPFFEVDKKKTWLLRLHASQVLWHLAEAVEIVNCKLTILASHDKVGSINNISVVKNATLQREASTISRCRQRHIMRLKIRPNFSKHSENWCVCLRYDFQQECFWASVDSIGTIGILKRAEISEINNGSLVHNTCVWKAKCFWFPRVSKTCL